GAVVTVAVPRVRVEVALLEDGDLDVVDEATRRGPRRDRSGTTRYGDADRSDHDRAADQPRPGAPGAPWSIGDWGRRHRASDARRCVQGKRFPRACQPPASDQTASSFPLGSAKWKRRPPGNENVGRTILAPAALIFFSTAARSTA